MELTFDDEQKIIFLATPSGNKITLSEADSGIVIQDQNGNKITLNSSGIKILDTDASNTLGIIVGSDLTADRTTSMPIPS